MAVNNLNDSRINSRSPYYLEAGRAAPQPVVIPDPVEHNTPPTVTISTTNLNPYIGDTVTLTAIASDADGSIVGYQWGGFGSGTTQSIDVQDSSAITSQIYMVTVTDDDGDTATALITINWQKEPVIIKPDDLSIQCGDIVNEADFVGSKQYTLDVGDKIGNVNITFLTSGSGTNSIPVRFTAVWDTTTETTGYIGDSAYDDDLSNAGVSSGDINTSANPGTTNKGTGTQLTINKTAATPETISLTAFTPLQNDSYSFRLDCPDVLAVPTKFITLKSTCDGGTARFTYTDVDGATQEVVIEDGGQPVVVSAQPNTAVVTECTGTVGEGGDSFGKGTPDLQVNSDLEINFYVGTTGENGRLEDVVTGELKDHLLKFYNNDSATYDTNVNVYSMTDTNASSILPIPSERVIANCDPNVYNSCNSNDNAMRKPWRWIREPAKTSGKRVLNIAMASSATPFYHKSNGMYPQYIGSYDVYADVASQTDSLLFHAKDLQNLKQFYDTATNYGDALGILFVVEGTSTNTNQFKEYLGHLQNSTYGLTGKVKGIDDRSEIGIAYGLGFYDTSQVMKDKIVEEMRKLGYTV